MEFDTDRGLAWVLTNNPDADLLCKRWALDTQAVLAVPTGYGFDAVAMPVMLGQAVALRMEVCGYRVPAARCGEDVVFLLAAGSTWDDDSVPAALQVHAHGSQVSLPHPGQAHYWINPPTGGAAPGLLVLLPHVRELLAASHYRHTDEGPSVSGW